MPRSLGVPRHLSPQIKKNMQSAKQALRTLYNSMDLDLDLDLEKEHALAHGPCNTRTCCATFLIPLKTVAKRKKTVTLKLQRSARLKDPIWKWSHYIVPPLVSIASGARPTRSCRSRSR